jgi:hypothetical protein
MSYPPCKRPLPYARLDPVDSFSEALWLMLSTIDTEPIEETVLFVLDDSRCGVGVTLSTGSWQLLGARWKLLV